MDRIMTAGEKCGVNVEPADIISGPHPVSVAQEGSPAEPIDHYWIKTDSGARVFVPVQEIEPPT